MAETSFPYNPLHLPGNAFTLWVPVRPRAVAVAVPISMPMNPKPLTLPGHAFTVWIKPPALAAASAVSTPVAAPGPRSTGTTGPIQLPGKQFTVWTRGPVQPPAPPAPPSSPAGPSSAPFGAGLLKLAALLVVVGLLVIFLVRSNRLAAENEELKKRNAIAAAENTDVTGRLAAAEAKNVAAQDQARQLHATVNNLESTKVSLTSERQALDQKVKVLNEQMTAVKKEAETRVVGLQQNIETLTRDRNAVQKLADAGKTELDKKTAALTEATKNAKQAQEKITATEKLLSDAKTTNDQLKKDNEQIKTDADKMKATVEAATRDKEELRKSVEALVTTIKELEKALADAKKAASGQ